MSVKPRFLGDKLETLVRKCIVFPANGSETHLVHMIARTVTTEDDITSLCLHSRCVDMVNSFGDEYRKIQVMTCRTAESTYLFFYNLSPNLPVNLNIANVTGVAVARSKAKKRLFWRGDVVAMKVQPESETIDFMVQSLDADLSEMTALEDFLRQKYREGEFERLLSFDEHQWTFYLSNYRSHSLLGAPESYWGPNAKMKEESFLNNLNELRCIVGRPPLPRPTCMQSYTERVSNLYASFKSALFPEKVTGPPRLPSDLEHQIFETCALDNPEFCTVLVLVARRVYEWVDPILLRTVCIVENLHSTRRDMLDRFLVKLSNGKPVKYFAQHIKNLAFFGPLFETKKINRILAICSGVENLVLNAPAPEDSFKIPRTACGLRRLSVRVENLFQVFGSPTTFHHPYFANLTHLHLSDDDEYWPFYEGWETLTSLTHLALACAGPVETMQIMRKLPVIKYVALGHYVCRDGYDYGEPTINNSPHIRAAWGVRIVFLSEIQVGNWEQGARGNGDFWDIVEQEVERRLREEQQQRARGEGKIRKGKMQ